MLMKCVWYLRKISGNDIPIHMKEMGRCKLLGRPSVAEASTMSQVIMTKGLSVLYNFHHTGISINYKLGL